MSKSRYSVQPCNLGLLRLLKWLILTLSPVIISGCLYSTKQHIDPIESTRIVSEGYYKGCWWWWKAEKPEEECSIYRVIRHPSGEWVMNNGSDVAKQTRFRVRDLDANHFVAEKSTPNRNGTGIHMEYAIGFVMDKGGFVYYEMGNFWRKKDFEKLLGKGYKIKWEKFSRPEGDMDTIVHLSDLTDLEFDKIFLDITQPDFWSGIPRQNGRKMLLLDPKEGERQFKDQLRRSSK